MTLRLVLAALVVVSLHLAGAAQERPLPERDAFYRAVRENLVRAERVTHLYTYKERRTDVHTNPFGTLGTSGTSLFEVYPSPMRRMGYRRLVQRNGTTVTDAALAEQDRAYRARVTEVQEQAAAARADDESAFDAESGRARERRQRALNDVIDALEFQLKGRTVRNGVPALLIAFTPKTSVQPVTRQGRLAQKFAGSIWVDEASTEVMEIDATSIDDMSYGLGLVARLAAGTRASVTRRPIEGGVWMPIVLTLTGRGRALVFRRLDVDFSIEWFDYRRLPVESLTPFLDPRVQRQSNSRPQ